ncbi:MAG: hypothetical protein R3E87_06185 [Burkholderiaceae bacterium]
MTTALRMPLARLWPHAPRPVTRLARPGIVWGSYPEREEREGDERRVGALRDFGAVANLARRRLGRSGDAGAVRRRLLTEGWCDDAVADALACVAAALQASLGHAPRDNQWQAAAGLLDQRLIELDTGEGKTLAAAMAAGAAALAGSPVHVLTANDYLAERDARTMTAAFASLGLHCRAATGSADDTGRRNAYAADICYATARTVAFDYLRDQDGLSADGRQAPPSFLRGLCMAIVDEADAILLDEALMPLVLATGRQDPEHRARLWQTLDLARQLTAGSDYELDRAAGQVYWHERGLHAVAELAARYRLHWINDVHRDESVLQALRALHLLERDVHYTVRDSRIVLIDQTTGRAAPARQLPGDLHGLVALKEGATPPAPTEAGTGLTYPRLFARYCHLSGLSGTLTEDEREFRQVYGLRVTRVARDKPSRLRRGPTRLFDDDAARTHAVIERATALARRGRPVLIGSDSIRQTRALAGAFAARGVDVQCIDAGDDLDEARAVAEAGRHGRITIATQMAGRGTDIEPNAQALAAGGLHVLNLQLNRSGRIDRQMFGRAARRGERGSAEHWLCADARQFAVEKALPIRSLLALARVRGRARALLRVVQAYWQLEDRSARSASLASDRAGSRRLHFTSMGRR